MRKFDLLRDDIRKIFFRYLIPGVLSSVAVSLYVFVDTLFVGLGVGKYGIVALNVAIPLFTVFTSLFLCIGIGGSNILSISRSKNDKEGGHKIFTNVLIFATIIGIMISILGIIFVNPIGEFLGASLEVKELFREYFIILVSFSWAFLIAGVLGCFIRNDNNPRLVMIATVTANIVNVVFDYIFIFWFNLGMKGAVLATVMSPIVNILILLTHFMKKSNSLKLCKIKFDFVLIGRVLVNGFGTFILEFCRGISIFLFNNILIMIGGNTYVAVYGILLNVSYVIISICSGIAQSIQPIVSTNYGEKLINRAISAFKYGVLVSVIFGIFLYIFIFLFGEQVSSLFTTEDYELIKITSSAMKVYFIGCIFMSFNTVAVYFFQSIDKSKISMTISLSSGIIFIVIGFILLVKSFGILGVWFVYPFAEFFGFLIALFKIFRSVLKNKRELVTL